MKTSKPKAPKFASKEGTLKEAKDYLNTYFSLGIKCPCCMQTVKLYSVPFSSNMAMFLISLVKLYEKLGRPIHYKECKFGSRNYPFLSKWGLMTTEKAEGTKKRTNGLWIPTQKGIDFVHNKSTVQVKAKIYNNTFYGFEGKEINIIEALKRKFDYQELMDGKTEIF